MARIRNVLVHMYADIDLTKVKYAVENRLGHLLSFVAAIRPLL